MKTFGMLAVSGLLTAVFAYAVPAIADDTSAAGANMQPPASLSAAQPTSPAPDAPMQNNNVSAQADTNVNPTDSADTQVQNNNTLAQSDTSGSSTGTTDSTSDTMADMPSGDDDY